MSLADRVAVADPAGSFIYLLANGDSPADYVVQIEGRREDGSGGTRDEAGKFKHVEAFSTTFTIIESNNPQRPVGMTGVSWYQGSDKTGYEGRVRAFFNAAHPDLAKATPAEFKEVYEAATDKDVQVLAGVKLRARVTKIKARLSGRDIDAVSWEPYVEKAG